MPFGGGHRQQERKVVRPLQVRSTQESIVAPGTERAAPSGDTRHLTPAHNASLWISFPPPALRLMVGRGAAVERTEDAGAAAADLE